MSRLASRCAPLLAVGALSGCATVAHVTTLSDAACQRSVAGGFSNILLAQGESADVAARLAESTTRALSYGGPGPRPFLVASPSGVDYSFFVDRREGACLLRLYGRQKGFVAYTNNLTYIATEPLASCGCSE